MARGYWGRPADTSRIFHAKLEGGGNERYLRTGDLGFLWNRELFVTGRLKDCIILRGRNYYPQDFERTVGMCHPALRQNAGAAFSIPSGAAEQLIIVSEVNHRQSADWKKVADAIRQAIAYHHDAAAHGVVLLRAGDLPRTSSGKIRRGACRKAFLDGSLPAIYKSVQESSWLNTEVPLTREDLLASQPEQQLERLKEYLVSVLAGVMRTDVGELDQTIGLIGLGLDSLAVTELCHRIEQDLQAPLHPHELLSAQDLHTVIERLLSAVQQRKQGGDQRTEPDLDDSPFMLSAGQIGLWFLDQLTPGTSALQISRAVRLRQRIDAAALERVIEKVVARHPMLRVRFLDKNHTSLQQITEHSQVSFKVVDASGWSDDTLSRRISSDFGESLSLTEGPLMRICLYQLQADDHVLALTVHHINSDFWSLRIFMLELAALYAAEVGKTQAVLPPPVKSFRHHVLRQNEMLSSPEGERLWKYWQEKLSAPLPVTRLLPDHPRMNRAPYRAGLRHLRISLALTESLKNIARLQNTTLYTVLLSVFSVLLKRHIGQDDLLIGSPTHGRRQADMNGVFGCFINPLVIRADLSNDPSFNQVVSRLAGVLAEALDNQEYPFPMLAERLPNVREPGLHPIFQIMFSFQQAPAGGEQNWGALALALSGERVRIGRLEMEPLPLTQSATQFDLTLNMAECGGGLAASIEYNADLYEAETIERLAGHLKVLLEGVAQNPDRRIATLPLQTERERQQLVEWNATSEACPEDLCLHDLFEAQVIESPDAPAVSDGKRTLSYAQLNAVANHFASRLERAGAGLGTVVALCAERSIETIAVILGVLKAGCAYLPLDPDYPEDRLLYMIETAQARIVFCEHAFIGKFAGKQPKILVLNINEESAIEEPGAQENPSWVVTPLTYSIHPDRPGSLKGL